MGRKLNEAGFSLLEVLVAAGLSILVFGILTTFQAHLADYALAVQQKLQAVELETEMGRALMDGDVCTCNAENLPMVAQPDGTFAADFPAARVLTSEKPRATVRADGSVQLDCINPPPPDRILAQADQALAGGGARLPVQKIRVANLRRSNGAALVGEEYIGNFEVLFGAKNDNSTGHMKSPLPPARSVQRFYVRNNTIIGCGPAPNEITYSPVGNLTNNDRQENTRSTARCPPGTKVIAGGWLSLNSPPPKAYPADLATDQARGCIRPNPLYPGQPTPYYADTIFSYPVQSTNEWRVLSQCHAVQAIAVCFKPHIER